MSGGHFNYDQYKIGYIADEIEQLIRDNGSEEKDQYGYNKHSNFSDEVIEKFHEALVCLKVAQIYAHRIDWLVSGDDGEDSFLSRLKQDKKNLRDEFYKFLDEVENADGTK